MSSNLRVGGECAPAKSINTIERLARIKESKLMDSAPQREFDELVQLAAEAIGCEVALITILDDQRQWFKAANGILLKETPLEWSFCAHAIESPGQLMIVEDATIDARVCASPLVLDQPGFRSYMGMPLCTEDGIPFGTLCVIDRYPRTFSDQERNLFKRLAVLGEYLINAAHRAAIAMETTRAKSEQKIQHLVMMLT